jgi:hypothetical protein
MRVAETDLDSYDANLVALPSERADEIRKADRGRRLIAETGNDGGHERRAASQRRALF